MKVRKASEKNFVQWLKNLSQALKHGWAPPLGIKPCSSPAIIRARPRLLAYLGSVASVALPERIDH